ncbi:membrane protein [Allostella sp. ATCC 35155]|nr:membrane protein [Stella sp. ATCC 35155]
MSRRRRHVERHAVERIGWLRAAVLGANDGILSTASLIVGVAAADAARGSILIAGMAGLVAGAMSMAAGEYVSVSSQSDTEKADIAREAGELRDNPEAELDELTDIYVKRGLTPDLARLVAVQLTANGGLDAHVRDELNLSEMTAAQPVQAALTSAATFAAGAALPMLTLAIVPDRIIAVAVTVSALVFLALLGAIGAAAGGAGVTKAVVRVTFWGAIAMAITAGIGKLFGTMA